MNLDQWAWIERPIDPCPRDMAVVPKNEQPKCGFWKRFWSLVTRKRVCSDE